MQVTELESDILVFRGAAYESLATAFVHGRDALLVDALAEQGDAEAMRAHLEGRLGLRVRLILMTHYMSDHMAGLRLFPRARVAAHRFYAHTFLSQRNRSPQEEREFVPPSIELGGDLAFDWGCHRLRVFHNPGKTPCMLNVDVAAADLAICSDNLVCNTVYLSHAAPELLDAGLVRLQQLGRGRVVPGHMGVLPGTAVTNARHYLKRLGEQVMVARSHGDAAANIRAISIEACLSPGVEPSGFERQWHTRNLEVVRERSVFATPHHRIN
ncbi:MAG TPA: MBL fold metallo-hydrolase [Gammaproteobacteria bacterium]|nr:MBL fold metallo-hydrolase [Gammaproteobacteria bacterium]